MLRDTSAIVKSKAALFLSVLGELQLEKPMQDILSSATSEAEVLLILGDITYMKDYLKNTTFHIEANSIPFSAENIQWRLEYINLRRL